MTADPVGLAPIFLSLTDGLTRYERRTVAVRATVIAAGILTFFVLLGQPLLHWLGIGLPAFRIGGGILLFWIAFEMVFERHSDRKQETATAAVHLDHVRDVSAFPLAIPLMAGPGAITAVILLASRTDGNIPAVWLVLLLVFVVAAIRLLVFIAAEKISGLLGRTGSVVLSRLLGVLLTVLAVQFVVNGIFSLLVER